MAIVRDLSDNRPNNAPIVDGHINNNFSATDSDLVTPSDTTDLLDGITSGVSVDVAGTLVVTFADGTIDTLTLAAGIIHPISVKRIWTASTATGIHAYYI